MGDALSWVPWWLATAVVFLAGWCVISVVFGAAWSLAATLVKRAARRRYCRRMHPSVTAYFASDEGRAYADEVLAEVKRRAAQ